MYLFVEENVPVFAYHKSGRFLIMFLPDSTKYVHLNSRLSEVAKTGPCNESVSLYHNKIGRMLVGVDTNSATKDKAFVMTDEFPYDYFNNEIVELDVSKFEKADCPYNDKNVNFGDYTYSGFGSDIKCTCNCCGARLIHPWHPLHKKYRLGDSREPYHLKHGTCDRFKCEMKIADFSDKIVHICDGSFKGFYLSDGESKTFLLGNTRIVKYTFSDKKLTIENKYTASAAVEFKIVE